jgi:hypothetical protein
MYRRHIHASNRQACGAEGFKVAVRWEWLNTPRERWQEAGAREFRAWLSNLNPLAKAWMNERLSVDQEVRFRVLLHRHGETIEALRRRGFRVRPATLMSLRRCACDYF